MLSQLKIFQFLILKVLIPYKKSLDVALLLTITMLNQQLT